MAAVDAAAVRAEAIAAAVARRRATVATGDATIDAAKRRLGGADPPEP